MRHQQQPQNRVASFLEQIAIMKECRQRNAEHQALVQSATPKLPTHVHRNLRGERGFELSLRGFDFADRNELERVRWEYRQFLQGCRVDPAEADQLNHSWEFAAHRYEKRTGKQFMLRTAWRAALDLRPGSEGLKLWDHSLDLQKVKRYRRSIHRRRPRFGSAAYRKYFAAAEEKTGFNVAEFNVVPAALFSHDRDNTDVEIEPTTPEERREND